jgi:predicted oxidoreductase
MAYGFSVLCILLVDDGCLSQCFRERYELMQWSDLLEQSGRILENYSSC